MKNLRNILLAVALLCFCSCTEPEDILWNPGWGTIEEPENKPDTPDQGEDPDQGGNPDQGENPDNSDQPEPEKVGKARFVWIDAAANFKDYADTVRALQAQGKGIKTILGGTDAVKASGLFEEENIKEL